MHSASINALLDDCPSAWCSPRLVSKGNFGCTSCVTAAHVALRRTGCRVISRHISCIVVAICQQNQAHPSQLRARASLVAVCAACRSSGGRQSPSLARSRSAASCASRSVGASHTPRCGGSSCRSLCGHTGEYEVGDGWKIVSYADMCHGRHKRNLRIAAAMQPGVKLRHPCPSDAVSVLSAESCCCE